MLQLNEIYDSMWFDVRNHNTQTHVSLDFPMIDIM